uniref:metallophosphoesterase family protein n=1 Tax=Pararhizobium sp. IMCC3301 TaxID=3067904 RepID=UPI002740B1BF|nr:metallophosphoesterase family protein [Pararhizobium sp. IMCC3301]
MRFAAISDIHGNHLALEAVLDDIAGQGIDQIVNLGDHFGGPLEAGKTADLLVSQRKMMSIRGNHDRFLLELAVQDLGTWDAPAFRQLNETHLEWVAALPQSAVFESEIFLCHGIPSSDSEHWLDTPNPALGMSLRPLADIEREAGSLEFPIMLCGHSHVSRVVRLSDGRRVINPGSVGCPGFKDTRAAPYVMHTGNPFAAYAIIEKQQSGDWNVTFRHVPYDHQAMAELARSKGFADWASALSTGWVN